MIRPNFLPPPQTPVIVGLSGGVDSAVAAIRLLEAGCRVAGLFMSNWDEDDAYCTSAADLQDARAVCDELGIVLHTVNFAAQYRSQVFESFLEEHRRGRTPNPDVLCNREIKFGLAAAHARRLGADYFATGHYARRIDGAEGPELHKAVDQAKDQSYFLHCLDRSQLEQAVFPLGDLQKADVRAIARRAGLAVHDKPDSTGICFIGERPFREFLAEYLPSAPGPIETADGQRLGEHQGLAFYTLGQRGGLQIGGRAGHAEAPWYVAAKIPARNALIVVQQHEHPLLLSSAVDTLPMHWLHEPREQNLRCSVKLRYRQPDQSAVAERLPQGGLRLRFELAQRAATPGQYAVLYDAERCLGGAVIDHLVGA